MLPCVSDADAETAGLCVEDRAQQDTILSLIDECEARCGWPMSGLREDLRKEWSRAVA
jgi:hypothetical protein